MDLYYKTDDLLTGAKNNATGSWIDTFRARSANFTLRGTGAAIGAVSFKLFKPDPFGVAARGVEFFSMGLFNGYATSGITQYLPIDKVRAELSGIGTGWAWASISQQN